MLHPFFAEYFVEDVLQVLQRFNFYCSMYFTYVHGLTVVLVITA